MPRGQKFAVCRSPPPKGRSIAWNRGAPTVSNEHNNTVAIEPNNNPSLRLEDYDLIECVDLTISIPMESSDPFREPALSFGGTDLYAQGNAHCLW